MENNRPDDYPADSLDTVFGSRVRQLRKARGWSQDRLASRMSDAGFEMHQTTVAKLENGSRPLRFSEAVAIARIFEVSLEDMYTRPRITADVPGVDSRALAAAQAELEAATQHQRVAEEQLRRAKRRVAEADAERERLDERCKEAELDVERARDDVQLAEQQIEELISNVEH